MEPEIRALIGGLDVRTRALVGMLARLFTVESEVGGCDWTNDLYNEVLADEGAIERGCRELADDPAVQLLCGAHQLVRRLEESEEGGATDTDTDTDTMAKRAAGKLLAIFGQYLPDMVQELVEGLKGLHDQIAALDSPEGEAACMAAMTPLRDPPLHEFEVRDILDVFRKYPADLRGPIVSAALCQARAAARAATVLGGMEVRFAKAIEGLDDRTKAILRIVRDLERIDGSINSDFGNVWQRAVEEAEVGVLWGRPEYTVLLTVYEQCKLVQEVTR
jgi:hypothetical protein